MKQNSEARSTQERNRQITRWSSTHFLAGHGARTDTAILHDWKEAEAIEKYRIMRGL